MLLYLGIGAQSGCRNRAYSDLYVENMAAEIRDLEDQLYEYDHEYRLLEQQVDAMRRENAAMSRSISGDQSSSSIGGTPAPLEFEPRGIVPIKPEPALSSDGNGSSGKGSTQRSSDPSSILDPQAESRPPRRSPFPGNAPPNERAPSRGELLPPPGNGESSREAPADGTDFDTDSLVPPTIEPGEPLPPELPVLTLDSTSAERGDAMDSLEMNLSRIEIPAQLVSDTSADSSRAGATVEQVTDQRVVELAFHPTLSRSANFDDRTDDDGVYLVLQPKNVAGQMVPVTAQLSVVVLDPAREGNAARIGRWEYTPVQVEANLEPIGANQGIHLRLPWKKVAPIADRVIVFARYTFDNGRQVIGQKEILISNAEGFKTVWGPRGTAVKPVGPHHRSGQVVQASATSNEPVPVVRPEAGIAPAEVPRPPISTDSTWRW